MKLFSKFRGMPGSSKINELISKSILINTSTNILLEKIFEIINTIAV